MADDVAVIGGGWSGFAAAITLVDAGRRVAVFEASRTLGGRARRVEMPGMTVDNGQHLLLGAYHDTLRLIHRVHPGRAASELYLRMPLQITGPGDFSLRARGLPSPLHMLAALLTAKGCTIGERLALVRAFAGWKRNGWRAGAAQTVASLLAGQPVSMIDRIWSPLCLAALNTPIASASAQVYLNVLRDALAADRAASDLVIPLVDLSALFPDAAARIVESSGGSVQRGARVRRIVSGEPSVMVEGDGFALRFRTAIVATAPRQALQLLAGMPQARDACAQMMGYAYQPICTVYLRYARPVRLSAPMLQLDGSPGQWVFALDDITGVAAGVAAGDAAAARGVGRVAVVISADGQHRSLPHDALAHAVAVQLAREIGTSVSSEIIASQVITERRATFACVPGRAHPAAGVLGSGIAIAGDHTDPDYPATLEAACRSGIRAARAVLALG